ncbi:hypothetical protein T492DRAFT_552245 [Pavlovales sp. CCMP2436]|nr:hypothetical protein T492DRAFT_552245 [Pavlovales sp. CCMP2436]
MNPPVMVLNTNTKRESGRKAQLGNITAGKAVADIIRTTLGPKSMLKMLLDPTGGIVMTNDGNAILREVDVSHPGAKSMVELSRAQDEEVSAARVPCPPGRVCAGNRCLDPNTRPWPGRISLAQDREGRAPLSVRTHCLGSCMGGTTLGS